jgi:hypothetical protein
MLRFHDLVLCALTLGLAACGGKVVPSTDTSDASLPPGEETAPVPPPDSRPPSDTPTPPTDCCPVDPPSCSCPRVGGSPPCTRGPCDVADWDSGIDGRGCAYIRPRGTRSCLSPDSGPTPDRTVGKTCSTDADCDVSGMGITFCSNTLFVMGTLYPTPVCFGTSCVPSTGGGVTMCDGGFGVCVPSTVDGICAPYCTFGGGGAPATGCAGKNACTPYRWSPDPSGVMAGVGLCLGGCRVDADCTKGDKCQVEQGFCKKTLDVYSKKLGDACDKSDTTAKPPRCNCLLSASGAGYCTQTCRMYLDVCSSGFTCDPQLPRADFPVAPKGITGWCLKNCATDTDCAGLSAKCLESASTGQKTCQPGITPF